MPAEPLHCVLCKTKDPEYGPLVGMTMGDHPPDRRAIVCCPCAGISKDEADARWPVHTMTLRPGW